MFLRDIQNNEKKINHEGHEAHEVAQAFRSGDRDVALRELRCSSEQDIRVVKFIFSRESLCLT